MLANNSSGNPSPQGTKLFPFRWREDQQRPNYAPNREREIELCLPFSQDYLYISDPPGLIRSWDSFGSRPAKKSSPEANHSTMKLGSLLGEVLSPPWGAVCWFSVHFSANNYWLKLSNDVCATPVFGCLRLELMFLSRLGLVDSGFGEQFTRTC